MMIIKSKLIASMMLFAIYNNNYAMDNNYQALSFHQLPKDIQQCICKCLDVGTMGRISMSCTIYNKDETLLEAIKATKLEEELIKQKKEEEKKARLTAEREERIRRYDPGGRFPVARAAADAAEAARRQQAEAAEAARIQKQAEADERLRQQAEAHEILMAQLAEELKQALAKADIAEQNAQQSSIAWLCSSLLERTRLFPSLFSTPQAITIEPNTPQTSNHFLDCSSPTTDTLIPSPTTRQNQPQISLSSSSWDLSGCLGQQRKPPKQEEERELAPRPQTTTKQETDVEDSIATESSSQERIDIPSKKNRIIIVIVIGIATGAIYIPKTTFLGLAIAISAMKYHR